MIRRSRCLVLICGSLFMIQILIILSLKLDNKYKLADHINTSVLDLRKLLLKEEKKDLQNQLNEDVDQLFHKLYVGDAVSEERKEDAWLVDIKHTDDVVVLKDIYEDEGQSEVKAHYEFDPRTVLTVLFQNLNKLEKGSLSGSNELSSFHWSDWTNITLLYDYINASEKYTCKNLFDFTTTNKQRNRKQELHDPSKFCFDDSNIKEMMQSEGFNDYSKSLIAKIRDSDDSPGFHVFASPGRSSKQMKVLQAKSYLNDFMPPPAAVLFLFPPVDHKNKKKNKLGSIPLRLSVNQDPKNRHPILKSAMGKSYIEINKQTDETSKKDLVFKFSQEFDILSNKLIDLEMEKAPDSIPYNRELAEDDFIDKSSDILASLEKLKDNELSDMDRRYKNGLQYSLNTVLPPKYFNEAKIMKKEKFFALGGHYDWRFFNDFVNYTYKQKVALYGLINAWLTFTNSYNFATWIAHGSLLSWYWDGISFPWDFDIDVQMPISELHRLTREFNQTIIVNMGNSADEIKLGRYFLDSGSFISTRSKVNGNNNIDARFIDLDTGLYIDITALALTATRTPIAYRDSLPNSLSSKKIEGPNYYEKNAYLKIYNCRNNHFYSFSDLSPLRLTAFEGIPSYIPNKFLDILHEEYSVRATSGMVFKGYTFVPRLNMWVQTKAFSEFISSKAENLSSGNPKERLSYNELVGSLKDEDYLNFLSQNEDILIEYVKSREITKFHSEELKSIFDKENTRDLFIDKSDQLKINFPSLRHDYTRYLRYVDLDDHDDTISLQTIDVAKHKIPYDTIPSDRLSHDDDEVQVTTHSKEGTPQRSHNDKALPPLSGGSRELPMIDTITNEELDDKTRHRNFITKPN